jgi:hypothetical protein
MSFSNLKLDELRKVAETFAVEHETAKNKADLIALLAEEGVSYDMYAKFTEAEKAEADIEIDERTTKAAPDAPGVGQVLVKMERMNPRYDVNEFTFTQDNPFIVMTEKKAQEIFDTQQGFRLATPKEAQEFYS